MCESLLPQIVMHVMIPCQHSCSDMFLWLCAGSAAGNGPDVRHAQYPTGQASDLTRQHPAALTSPKPVGDMQTSLAHDGRVSSPAWAKNVVSGGLFGQGYHGSSGENCLCDSA